MHKSGPSPRDLRDLLRLTASGMAHNEVAAMLSTDEATVKSVLERAVAAGLSWPLPDTLDDAMLQQRMSLGTTTAPAATTSVRSPTVAGDTVARDLAQSIRNRTILIYTALALGAIVPGMALARFVDFTALQRAMVDLAFGRGFRFWLGVVGALMVLALLLYPLRKMYAQRFGVGTISGWFHLHIVFGIFGPLLILYHANFGFAARDINANVALLAILLVAASGFIGQFIYTSASLDFYAAKREVKSRSDALVDELKSLGVSDADASLTRERLDVFERDLPSSKLGLVESLKAMFRVAVHHQQLYRSINSTLAETQRRDGWPNEEFRRARQLAGKQLATTAAIARRASGHSIYEQVSARWRVLHLPLFLIAVGATALHVWAVWDRTAFTSRRPIAAVAPIVPSGQASAVYTPDDAVQALRRWDQTTQALTTGQSFFANASFAGSLSCKGCHQEQFTEWANTWHAKMYRTVNDPSAKGDANIVVSAFDSKPVLFENVMAAGEAGGPSGAVSFEVVPTMVHPKTGAPGYYFTVRDPTSPDDDQIFQVAIVIGGHLEQSFHIKIGDHHFPAPLRWKVGPPDVGAYQNDGTPQPQNWVYFRGAGKKFGKPRTAAQLPFDRVAEAQCIGCHTTGYTAQRPATPRNAKWQAVGNSVPNGVDTNGALTGALPGPPGTVAELGVGCEACHGPGSAHNAAQSDPGGAVPVAAKPLVPGKIVHPLKHMSMQQQSIMCATCHSRGINDVTPGTQATADRAASPLGYPDVLAKAGDRPFLAGDTDLFARVRLFGGFGQNRQAFWPNDWARQSRMQWHDFAKSAHHTANAASCLTCHSGHAPMKSRVDNDKFQLRQSAVVHAGKATSKTENQCEACHKASGSTTQPNKEMFEGSPMHAAGVTCINCHMAAVGNRVGRTTRTPSKPDGTFDTNPANYGKHWDMSSHLSRVASTSESAELTPGIGMRSACVSCHGPNPLKPVGSTLSDKKLDEIFACRKEFVRDRLDRLRSGMVAAERAKGITLNRARAELGFVAADRSWGAHNWDKTLLSLRAAAEDIGASCSGDTACQVSRLVAVNTQECSSRTTAVLAPRIAPPPVTVPVTGPSTLTQGAAPPLPVATAAKAPAVTAPPPPVAQIAPPAAAPAPVVPGPLAAGPAAPTPVAPGPVASVATPLPPPQSAVPAPAPSAPSPRPAATVQPVPAPPVAAQPPPVAAQPLPAGSGAPPAAVPPAAVAVVAPPPPSAPPPAPPPNLSVFKDCPTCPDLIVLPSGTARLGSPSTEKGRAAIEGPQRDVAVTRRFAASRAPVTRAEFDAFVADAKPTITPGCRSGETGRWVDRPDLSYASPGFAQDGTHPVVCVSFDDATAYAAWLTSKTGKSYRLLSEVEREYITRADTTTAYWWGDAFDPRMAAHDTRPRPVTGVSRFTGTLPGASLRPNPWGFYHVHGNVAEWTRDCWTRALATLTQDATPGAAADCTQRAVRGGGWSYWPEDMRSAYRESAKSDLRFVHMGFRLGRDLD